MVNPDTIFGRLGNRLFQMAYIYAQARRGDIPDIYVQDERFFKDYGEEIKTLFGVGIGKIDKVAIHVRRGDYVNNPHYVDLMSTSYYNKAIALFPNEKFLVFSDDIDFCKEKWGQYENFEFSEGTELEDLNKMASCKGLIMANSSFSWWGAYLSQGKVVAPKEWAIGIPSAKLLDKWIKI